MVTEEIKGRAQENLGSVEMSAMEGGPQKDWGISHLRPPGAAGMDSHQDQKHFLCIKKKKKSDEGCRFYQN